MNHTPQSNRVRGAVPEASPFSSVLARLPDLSPPKNKYTTSFGSLNPMTSPPPANTFGFRQQSAQTPGGVQDSKPIGAFELLSATPMKSLHGSEQQLGSPRYDLQSPKFPLFQPSPQKPLGSQPTPPSVRLADSSTAGAPRGRFASPFSMLLDGSSRSGPSPADGGTSISRMTAPRQQRFAQLFAQAGGALDEAAAALGSGDIPPPCAGLAPSYLSPLRFPIGSAPRRASSSGGGEPGGAGGGADGLAGAAAQRQQGGASEGGAAAGAGSDDVAAMLREGQRRSSSIHDSEEDEQREAEEEADGEEDEEGHGHEAYGVGSFGRPPPPRRVPSMAVRGAGLSRQQQLIQARQQRPGRRRVLQFGGGSGAEEEEEEQEQGQLVHSTLPQSPMCQPVKLPKALLLIPRLYDPSSASEEGSGSPAHRLRTSSGFSLDSPAVQAATHAAVAAALEASAGAGSSRRPARAAAAGAAAAAKAAADAAGTPVQRRGGSSYLNCSSSGGAGSLSSGLPPITPSDEELGAPPQSLFAGPKKCNCKKSKCLKLYCDCFANGGYCGPACSCANCANKVENRDLVRAQRDQIKQRNPNAFVQKIEADATVGGQHRRGCNCKKSHCMKKYCECFQAGVACGEHCKCESCHNTAGHANRRPPGGGASKRARTSGSTARPVVATRQHATRMSSAAAAGNVGMGRQYQTAHAAAALHSALAQAAGAAIERGKGAQQQQQQQQQGFFPLLQPGVVKASDGGTPLMLPLLLQQGSGSAPPPLPLPLPRDSSEDAAGGDASGSGGMKLSHYTPVASLLKDPPPGLTLPSPEAGGADAFSFHPSLAASLDGSSSGHSTPRASAAAAAAAAAAADFAFALDTPAVAAAAALATGISDLEKLLPAADVGGMAAAAAAAEGQKSPLSRPTGVRATPTKRKPARTMTAALS